MEETKTAAEQTHYLTFHVAGEEYAVNVLCVKEIIEYDALTKMPNTPPAVRGVINLRGSVIPVVDLAVKFGLPETRITKFTCIVIVEVRKGSDETVMGVMTDSVSQVISLSAEEIERAPVFGTQVNAEFIQGMGKTGKKFLLILNIDRLLSEESLRRQAAVPEPPAGPGATEEEGRLS